jgi:hypothetical protein
VSPERPLMGQSDLKPILRCWQEPELWNVKSGN